MTVKANLWMAAAAATVAAWATAGECGRAVSLEAKSPDGRNAIVLKADPLRYSVLRDGVEIVAESPIGMKIDGVCLAKGAKDFDTCGAASFSGRLDTPVYKKSSVDLTRREAFADFGDWGIRLVARNDGVAYRFETKKPGEITVNCEKACVTVPDAAAKCWAVKSGSFGCEENIPVATTAGALVTKAGGTDHIYLPLSYSVGGKFVAVTESDVRGYPIWNLAKTNAVSAKSVRFDSLMERAPLKTQRFGGWGGQIVQEGGRWVRIVKHADYLVKCAGTRTFPWRTFVLADAPSKFCEADIVRALATPAAKDADFSWVRPGKVAWDWWNCFDNAPKGAPNGGCTTKTYKRFIDFAAKTGVEYVIFDEGWSESLNIWKFHPEVDVPHLVEYANGKGVGIILWMAWAQVYGVEDKVASYFSRLGVKGFKVDFMDRGDAECANFLERFAAACAKHRMLVDYHGAYRPVGLQRMYPNILNYEGVHGLEQMKWFKGNEGDMMFNDVAAFFLRLTAGPMDYTPGAMENWATGTGYAAKHAQNVPGSVGTRCRQMAMMMLYEAPLQMLCDSPTNYEKNMESFAFMAKTPVVWANTVGLGGCPDCFAAAARQAKDGAWYAAAINTAEARDFTLDTSFLGDGTWKAEIFRDGADADKVGKSYVHETKPVRAGEGMSLHMAPGGGFIVRFVR